MPMATHCCDTSFDREFENLSGAFQEIKEWIESVPAAPIEGDGQESLDLKKIEYLMDGIECLRDLTDKADIFLCAIRAKKSALTE